MTEQEQRYKKLMELRAQGIPWYPARTHRTSDIATFRSLFPLTDSVISSKHILCGRLRLKRPHGKLTFGNIQDEKGNIQIVFNIASMPKEQYDMFTEYIDVGDILECYGTAFTTKKGEPSLLIESWTLLAKSLRPLPEKWHGLVDQEERYRRRYVDFLVHPELQTLFRRRAQFIRALRDYLEDAGFMQISVPVLEAIPGGADATPFVTHHHSLNIDLYLRISLELYQKRLMVGGFEKIYDLGPVFRNEGMSREHLQEFTAMECYWAYADYNDMMRFVENMYATIIQKVFGTLVIEYQGQRLDFTPPWPRVDYGDCVLQQTGINIDTVQQPKELRAIIHKRYPSISIEPKAGIGRMIDILYKQAVRPLIIQPTLLLHHPIAVSPLAKRHPDKSNRTERFQPLVFGMEVGNGFSELNDPLDQRERFIEQQQLHDAGDTEAQMMDEDFIEAIEYGMPPAAGFGVGIDRLFMICSNQPTIRDVVAFPLLRPRSITENTNHSSFEI